MGVQASSVQLQESHSPFSPYAMLAAAAQDMA